MKKVIYISLLATLLISLSSCNNDLQSNTPQKEVIHFALFRIFPDVYQEQMFDFIKNNSIKTISIVAKDLPTEKNDSLTYLEFDNDGKLKSRTTLECTTLGCLPYTNRQMYSYKDGKIDRVDQYTFADNSKSTLYYWKLSDTSKMNLFDWEDYSYKGDTVFSESAITKRTYVKDTSDKIVLRKVMAKSTMQNIENEFTNTDSTVHISSKVNFPEQIKYKTIKLTDDGIKIFEEENGDMELLQNWHMNLKGLPNSIDTYHNGEHKRTINIEYTYY